MRRLSQNARSPAWARSGRVHAAACARAHTPVHAHTRAHTHTPVHACTHTGVHVNMACAHVCSSCACTLLGCAHPCSGKVGAHTCTHSCACTAVQASVWCMHTHVHVLPCKHLVHALMHTHTRARTHAPVQASGARTLVHVHMFLCTHTHSVQASIWCTHTCPHMHEFLCMHLHTHAHSCAHSCACTAPLHTRSLQPLHPAAAPRSVPAGRARPPRAPQARRAFVFLPGCPL